MNKQEELREAFAKHKFEQEFSGNWDDFAEVVKNRFREKADIDIQFLASRNVVIKSDDQTLPDIAPNYTDDFIRGYRLSVKEHNQAGFVKTEPLINK